jgi:two-component system nitrate/nitrite response regulator NarL
VIGAEFAVVATANLDATHQQVESGLRPDLLIVDVQVADPEPLRRIRSEVPNVRSVVLLDVGRPATVPALARECVADGYLLKDISPDALARSLRLIMSGYGLLPRDLVPAMMADHRVSGIPGAEPVLTSREHDVVRLLHGGASNKRIANELDISPSTVKVHVKTLLRKLNVRTRTQAALWAAKRYAASAVLGLWMGVWDLCEMVA